MAQVEAHLEKNPTDGRGWNVLAPVLVRIGRYDDAVRAYRNSITYNGDSAGRRADLGEAWPAPPAASSPRRPRPNSSARVALDADEVKARYFLGLAAEQDGRSADAAAIWRAMLEKAPAGCAVASAGAGRSGGSAAPAAPALPDGAMAAAKDMSEADRDDDDPQHGGSARHAG